MASITLNKPSGGAMTISPEDGTSTDTVTIPAGGVVGDVTTRHRFYGGVYGSGNLTQYLLLGPVTYSAVTPTDTIDVSAHVNSNTVGLVVWLHYSHSGSSNHGYWGAEMYQSGNTDKTGFYIAHYNDYFNTDAYQYIIPWDKNNSSTDLIVDTVYSLNTSSSNQYNIYLCGTIDQVVS